LARSASKLNFGTKGTPETEFWAVFTSGNSVSRRFEAQKLSFRPKNGTRTEFQREGDAQNSVLVFFTASNSVRRLPPEEKLSFDCDLSLENLGRDEVTRFLLAD
jgi:hypothetical protein